MENRKMEILLDGVSKVINGETHLDNITLKIKSGATNVILGRTLAGKTSLLRLMAGLDRPTKGRIFLDGRDVTGLFVRNAASPWFTSSSSTIRPYGPRRTSLRR